MPLFGPPNVDAMKAKQDVKGLFRLMIGDEGDLGKHAAQALVDMGPPVAKPLLALADEAPPKSGAQEAVIGVLHAIGSPVVEPLLAVLQTPNAPGQLVAVHALGMMDDPSRRGLSRPAKRQNL